MDAFAFLRGINKGREKTSIAHSSGSVHIKYNLYDGRNPAFAEATAPEISKKECYT